MVENLFDAIIMCRLSRYVTVCLCATARQREMEDCKSLTAYGLRQMEVYRSSRDNNDPNDFVRNLFK